MCKEKIQKVLDIFSHKDFPIFAIIFMIGLVVGYLGGLFSVPPAPLVNFQSQKQSAQLEKAKRFFPVMPDARSFTGNIKSIQGNLIKMAVQESPNPFDEWPLTREVVVGDKTVIIQRTQKDPETYQKEMEDYQKAILAIQNKGTMANPVDMPVFPFPFEEKEITLDDLKPGNNISVFADENIKTKTRFEAARITVEPAPLMPGGAVLPMP